MTTIEIVLPNGRIVWWEGKVSSVVRANIIDYISSQLGTPNIIRGPYEVSND